MQARDGNIQPTAAGRVATMRMALPAAFLLLCLLVAAAQYFRLQPETELRAAGETQAAAEDVGAPAAAARDGVLTSAASARPRAGFQLEEEETVSHDPFSSNPPRSVAEQHVLRVVQTEIPDGAKVEQLLALVPSVAEDAQLLAVEHAAELISDDDYLRYRGRLFKLAHSEALREAVLDDVLTRGEDVRLPTLVEMLRLRISESERTEIREILEAYLDRDYGANPNHWERPVRQWVATVSDSER